MTKNKILFYKCLTYRVSSIVLTMICFRIVTGSFIGALSIGFLDFFIKLGLYFAHEKTWDFFKK